jgi:hypothetical protein
VPFLTYAITLYIMSVLFTLLLKVCYAYQMHLSDLSETTLTLAKQRIREEYKDEIGNSRHVRGVGTIYPITVFWSDVEHDIYLGNDDDFQRFFGFGACTVLAEELAKLTGGKLKVWSYDFDGSWAGHVGLSLNDDQIIDALGVHPASDVYETFQLHFATRDVVEETMSFEEFDELIFKDDAASKTHWLANGHLERSLANDYARWLINKYNVKAKDVNKINVPAPVVIERTFYAPDDNFISEHASEVDYKTDEVFDIASFDYSAFKLEDVDLEILNALIEALNVEDVYEVKYSYKGLRVRSLYGKYNYVGPYDFSSVSGAMQVGKALMVALGSHDVVSIPSGAQIVRTVNSKFAYDEEPYAVRTFLVAQPVNAFRIFRCTLSPAQKVEKEKLEQNWIKLGIKF